MMNQNITLINNDIDSSKKYKEFTELAAKDYDGLTKKIREEFVSGKEHDLSDYKLDILSEHSLSEYDNNIVSSLLLGLYLPAMLNYLIAAIWGNSNPLFSFIISAIAVFIVMYELKNNKQRKNNLQIKKAVLYLERFEISEGN
jgi:magnesium-transporting ATPase (P-type)